MISEKTALQLAESWYRAATAPGTNLQVTVSADTGGWLGRAVAEPRPASPLPMLRITMSGAVSIVGNPLNGLRR